VGSAEALGGSLEDQHSDAFWIGGDVIVPDAQDTPPLGFEKCCTAIVVSQLIKMLAAVEFDRQLRLAACQVDDI